MTEQSKLPSGCTIYISGRGILSFSLMLIIASSRPTLQTGSKSLEQSLIIAHFSTLSPAKQPMNGPIMLLLVCQEKSQLKVPSPMTRLTTILVILSTGFSSQFHLLGFTFPQNAMVCTSKAWNKLMLVSILGFKLAQTDNGGEITKIKQDINKLQEKDIEKPRQMMSKIDVTHMMLDCDDANKLRIIT